MADFVLLMSSSNSRMVVRKSMVAFPKGSRGSGISSESAPTPYRNAKEPQRFRAKSLERILSVRLALGPAHIPFVRLYPSPRPRSPRAEGAFFFRASTASFCTCKVTALRMPNLRISVRPIAADEGSVMLYDRSALADVAERIAATETRLVKLRERVERLQQEGSDARQAEEMLQLLSGNLGELYSRQSNMRRTSWVVGR